EKRGSLWVENANAQISITENALAGEYLIKHDAPAFHRVHEKPDAKRIALAREAVKILGVDWPEHVLPSEMLNQLDPNMPGFRAIRILVLRAQPRAVVSGAPASHDGLKLKTYDQMTAPMRRERDGRNHQFTRDARDGGESNVDHVPDVLLYAEVAQDRAIRINRSVRDCISATALKPLSGKVVKAEVIALSMRGIEVFIPEAGVERFIPLEGRNRLEASGTVLQCDGDHPLRIRLTDTIEVRIGEVDALQGKASLTPLSALELQPARQSVRLAEASAFNQVRGNGFRSKLVGKIATTEGVVSAINKGGFYIEQESGETGGILVRTRDAPVAVGDRVRVSGLVRERADKGNSYGRTMVEITDRPKVQRLTSGNLRDPVDLSMLGAPPSDYAGATEYWRALLGQRVRISSAATLSAMNRFGDLVVLPDGWEIPADRRSQYGGVLHKEGLENTIRAGVKYRDASGAPPALSVGAKLADLEGIVTYRSGDFQIELTNTPRVVSNPKIESEVTSLKKSATAFTVASMNALNANPKEEVRLRAAAKRIVRNMDSPDVLMLQEIQDNDGPKMSDVVAADKTYELLCRLIREEGGPDYGFVYASIDLPPRNGQDGGEPGGNIRNGYLYIKDRMKLIPESVERIGENNDAFKGSRKPAVAGFRFNGRRFNFMNTHNKSMLGSSPWTGEQQPPIIGGEDQRLAQAKFEREYIDAAVLRDPSAEWITMGDRNATPESASVNELTKSGFVNMAL
ncbi:MAG: RNB domain-containing ribonuclease, partial [Clostridia bacterium]|nr:RNB domain-containing ribonuclease [Deltaproteobacteria bacterium]